MIREAIVYVIAVVFAAVCAYTDWRVKKIYNKYTFPVMGSGILVNTLFWGIDGFKGSLLGLLCGFAFVLLFVLGALKAGDVKFYMALGALLGWKMMLQIAVFSILAGGAAGIGLMLLKKNGRERFCSLWLYLKSLYLGRSFRRYEPEGEGIYLCFGICIAIGVIWSIGRNILKV